jgi:hypothetical protein
LTFSRRGTWAIVIAIAFIYLLFLFPSPEFSAYNKDDAGLFVTLGTNLAEYGHYSVDTFPREDYGHQATWPPAFPIVLAAVIRVFGFNWPVLKLVMVAFGLGNLWLLWLLLERFEPYGVSRSIAVTTVVATALSPMYFLFSHMTMTEMPFMCATTAALLLMMRSKGEAGGLGAGLAATAAFFTRGYAITLLPAGLVFYLQRRGWLISKRVKVFACFALPFIAGMAIWYGYARYTWLHERLDGLTAHYGIDGGLAQNAFRPIGVYLRDVYWYHLRSVVHLFVPAIPLNTALTYDWMAAIGLPLFILSGIGWIGLARRGEYAASSWLLGSMVVTLAGRINGPRYWVTYLPFLVLGMLVGVRDLSARWNRAAWLFPAFASATILSVGLGLALHLTHPDRLRFLSPYWKEYQAAVFWVRDNVPHDAVIVTHSPHGVYGSVGIAAVEEGSELITSEAHSRPLYVLGPKAAESQLDRDRRIDVGGDESYARLDHDHRFDVVYDGRDVRVWRQLAP